MEPAIHFLALAGSRALPLDVHAAELHYSPRSGARGAERGVERPQLLCGWARVLNHTNRRRRLVGRRLGASDRGICGQEGEKAMAAAAICEQIHVLATLNEPTSDRVHAALDLLAGSGPSPELAEVLALDAGDGFVSGERSMQETIEAVDRIMVLSEELGLPEPAHALRLRGMARTAFSGRWRRHRRPDSGEGGSQGARPAVGACGHPGLPRCQSLGLRRSARCA